MNYVVDIADMKTSTNPEDVLVTYSLGSCVGLSVYDPVSCVGALIHCMLPLSSIDLAKAKANPFMFVDTGVVEMLKAVYALNGVRERLVVKAAGGGEPLGDNGVFRIGQRNYTVLRKLLWKNGILLAAEDCGGTVARTMKLHMGDGLTTIRSSGEERAL